MIDKQVVWNEIWPVIQRLVQGTAGEDEQVVVNLMTPEGQAAQMVDLFGLTIFEILLKIILGRDHLGLARAIESEKGRIAHIEIAWPDPDTDRESYTAAEVVSIQLKRYRKTWRVLDINPANADFPMTEARAQSILLSSGILDEEEDALLESWVLPVAVFAGALQLPIREGAMRDDVERLFLPGLQQRSFGVTSIVAGRHLWRDFYEKGMPGLDKPAAWAASAEFIMSEQALHDASQAAVGQFYGVGLAAMLPRIKEIKQTLEIMGHVDRYSPFGTGRLLVQDSG
jgi:hypothetical protein